jgi:hypothetical protein
MKMMRYNGYKYFELFSNYEGTGQVSNNNGGKYTRFKHLYQLGKALNQERMIEANQYDFTLLPTARHFLDHWSHALDHNEDVMR